MLLLSIDPSVFLDALTGETFKSCQKIEPSWCGIESAQRVEIGEIEVKSKIIGLNQPGKLISMRREGESEREIERAHVLTMSAMAPIVTTILDSRF